MTSAAYPTVYAALLTVADAALPTLRVVDGFDVSDDPGDVMMIGVPSLTDTTSISAGTFSQVTISHGATGFREENGSVNGIAMSWNGDGDATTARSTVFGYLDTLGAALRADPTLGLTAFDIKAQLVSGEVLEDQVDGATCAVSFAVAYKALI